MSIPAGQVIERVILDLTARLRVRLPKLLPDAGGDEIDGIIDEVTGYFRQELPGHLHPERFGSLDISLQIKDGVPVSIEFSGGERHHYQFRRKRG